MYLFLSFNKQTAIMERLFYCLTFVFPCMLNIYLGAEAIGINYGLLGDNLPPPAETISRLHQINVHKIRLFAPDTGVLTALHNSGISVIVGTSNQELQTLASNPSAAVQWVATNILPHYPSVNITCIAAGNEVFPGELTQYIPGAMHNLDSALTAANLSIPVSTAVSMQVLSVSYPPSSGAFALNAAPIMTQITRFLSFRKSPLLLNVYPYNARVGDPVNVKLEYALFQDGDTVVHDGPYTYLNLFDAMTDSVYAALEKVGGSDVEIVVTETGWPTDGGRDASVFNARLYVNNVIKHVASGKGTPRRPGKEIDTYIFAMFNEDLKPQGIEQHWGLHYPNLTQVYVVDYL